MTAEQEAAMDAAIGRGLGDDEEGKLEVDAASLVSRTATGIETAGYAAENLYGFKTPGHFAKVAGAVSYGADAYGLYNDPSAGNFAKTIGSGAVGASVGARHGGLAGAVGGFLAGLAIGLVDRAVGYAAGLAAEGVNWGNDNPDDFAAGLAGGVYPIVLDLDGDGVELTSLGESGAFYFQDEEGYRYRSGWVAGDDGLLVFDGNGDGVIDGNDELSPVEFVNGALGEAAALAAYDNNGDGVLTDLEALGHFDSDGDGRLSSADAEWGKFGVWQDLDGDGRASAEETRSLDEAGVLNVDLGYKDESGEEALSEGGNTIYGVANYQYVDGEGVLRTGEAGDVAFGLDGRVGVREDALGHLEYKFDDEVVAIYSGSGSVAGLSIDFGSAAYAAYAGAFGGVGDDVLDGSGVSRGLLLDGGSGSDVLVGGSGGDWLVGGSGSDSLRGGGGHDVLVFDSGDALVEGGAGYDYGIVADGGSVEVDLSAWGLEALRSGGGDDVLRVGGDGFLGIYGGVIYGGGGDDAIYGGSGGDVFGGEAGDDVLYGYGGDDMLSGGAGADSLYGGAGSDLLVVEGADSFLGGSGYDTVLFADDAGRVVDLNVAGVERVFGGGGDDSFSVSSDSDPAFSFSIGSLYNKAHLWLDGGGGNDSLSGGLGGDYLHGGEGDDSLSGGYGDDMYAFKRGGGHDVIFDCFTRVVGWVRRPGGVSGGIVAGLSGLLSGGGSGGFSGDAGGKSIGAILGGLSPVYFPVSREYDAGDDVLSLGGDIALSDLVFLYRGGNLEIGVKEKGGAAVVDVAAFDALSDKITLSGWSKEKRRIERLRLSDGTAIDLEAWVAFYGLAGEGGLPVELSAAMAGVAGVAAADAAEGEVWRGLSAAAGDAGVVAGLSVGEVLSALGEGAQRVYGFGGDDRVYAGLDGDMVHGGAGVDAVSYYGVLHGVSVDLSAGSAVGWSSDLVGSDAVAGGESGWTADALAGVEDAEGSMYDDWLRGDGGANELWGIGGDDVLDGGGGLDVLHGGSGDDAYVLGFGYDSDVVEELGGLGDSVRFRDGVTAGHVSLLRDGDDLLVRLSGGGVGNAGSELRVRGHFGVDIGARVESLEFADGVVWDAEVILSAVALVSGAGTEGRDIFDSDVGGDSVLRGGRGDDEYWLGWGTGHDTVYDEYREYRSTWVSGFSGSSLGALFGSGFLFTYSHLVGDWGDRVCLKSGIGEEDVLLHRNGSDLYVGLVGESGEVTDSLLVKKQFYDGAGEGAVGIEKLVFWDGVEWDRSAFKSAVIRGFAGDDALYGLDDLGDVFDSVGGGDDRLYGYGGDDVYWLGVGTGHDAIYEYYGNSGAGDSGDVIRVRGEASSIRLARSGSHLYVRLLGGDGEVTDSLRVDSYYVKVAGRVEGIEAEGGAVLLAAEFQGLIDEMAAFSAGSSDFGSVSDVTDHYWQDVALAVV